MAATLEKEALPANLLACCQALSDKKAVNLTVIDVKEVSSVTDYYVIATGESSPQLKAMALTGKSALKDIKESSGVIDGDPRSGWVVLDAFDFIVHLFTPESRELYAIESLWKDRPRIMLDL